MKRLLIIFCIPLFSFCQSNGFLRKGLRTTDFNEKLHLFSKAIETDSKNLETYFNRSLTNYNLTEYNAAILDFTKVIFYKPDADSYYNRANSKFNLEDYHGASEDYDKAIKLNPKLLNAYYNLGVTKHQLGNHDEALAYLKVAAMYLPNKSDIYIEMGRINQSNKKYKLALKNYTQAIRFSTSSYSYLNRGLSYLNVNYYKNAKDDFLKALTLNKNNTSAYFYLASAHLFLGEFTSSEALFLKLIKQDALDFDSYIGLSMVYLKSKQFNKAKSYFQKAKNVLFVKAPKNVKSFENTFWYKAHYFYFTTQFEILAEL